MNNFKLLFSILLIATVTATSFTIGSKSKDFYTSQLYQYNGADIVITDGFNATESSNFSIANISTITSQPSGLDPFGTKIITLEISPIPAPGDLLSVLAAIVSHVNTNGVPAHGASFVVTAGSTNYTVKIYRKA